MRWRSVGLKGEIGLGDRAGRLGHPASRSVERTTWSVIGVTRRHRWCQRDTSGGRFEGEEIDLFGPIEDRNILTLSDRERLAYVADLQAEVRWLRGAHKAALAMVASLTDRLRRSVRVIEGQQTA